MDFILEIERLSDEHDKQLSKYEDLFKTKKIKTEEAINSINKHYDKLIKLQADSVEETRNKLEDYKRQIVEYSNFNLKDLGEVIATIAKIYEGLEYIYTETFFDSDRKLSRVIVAGPNLYNLSSIIGTGIDPFKDGNGERGILLSKTSPTYNPTRYIYKINNDGNLELCIGLKHFPYIKEFIDILISYKIKKQKTYLPLEELREIRNKFILDRVSEISNYHYELEKARRKQLEDSIEKMRNNKIYFLEHTNKS